jgi:hypothetical protein
MKPLIDQLIEYVSAAPSDKKCFVLASQVVEVLGAECVQQHALSFVTIETELEPDNPKSAIPRDKRIVPMGYAGFFAGTLVQLLQSKKNETTGSTTTGSNNTIGTGESTPQGTNGNDIPTEEAPS